VGKRNSDEQASDEFLLVGIGASAGGLKPLLTFFDNLPAECSMSFVVVQHFDSSHESFMDKILTRHTDLKVRVVEDGETVQPGMVYIKPTDKDVLLEQNRLLLADPPSDEPAHLPIDAFFRSLAGHRGELGACVVLSGTGRDGTQGLQAVKRAGGLAIVQEQQQAEYKGMPGSAIDTGLADLVLPVEKIPTALLRYARHPYLAKKVVAESEDELAEKDVRSILRVVQAQTGHDFSRYKRSAIRRRIDRRLVLHQLHSLSEYIGYLRESPGEVQALFQDLTITVSGFFRDPEAYEALGKALRERIVKHKTDGDQLRAWVAGCSTGEEVYSVAVLITEAMEDLNKRLHVKLFATDINKQALNAARSATYPDTIRVDVSEERLERFFVKNDSSYRPADRIREMVVFALHDLTRDPPFSQLDLVCCRNLLIYMNSSLQGKVLSLLHYSLNPGGLLFLGTAENTRELADQFAPANSRQRVFVAQKSTRGSPHGLQAFAADTGAPKERETEKQTDTQRERRPQRRSKGEPLPAVRRLVEKVALEKYAPPAILVDGRFRILYFHGDADKYLRPPQGEPDWSILKLARKELHFKLRKSLLAAQAQGQAVSEKDLEVRYGNQLLRADLTVIPFREQHQDYLLVTFTPKKEEPLAAPAAESQHEDSDARVRALSQELYTVKQDLQATIEELETSNEELETSIEELETSNEELETSIEELKANNEELQSANEEMETAREELQSINEELQTVNAELQEKNRQLVQVNDDIENLFSTTSTGSVFLDQKMRIKRFTPAVRKVFKLIETDIGRPLTDFASRLKGVDILSEAVEVLETLNQKHIEIQTEDDEFFDVEIHPYRSTENIIEGVVITFFDISRFKHLELAAQDAQLRAESISNAVREPLLVLDEELQVHSLNQGLLPLLSLHV